MISLLLDMSLFCNRENGTKLCKAFTIVVSVKLFLFWTKMSQTVLTRDSFSWQDNTFDPTTIPRDETKVSCSTHSRTLESFGDLVEDNGNFSRLTLNCSTTLSEPSLN